MAILLCEACLQLFKAGVAEGVNAFLFSFGVRTQGKVLWDLDNHTLYQAEKSTADRLSRLAISEDKESDDLSDDPVAVSHIAITKVPKVLFMEAYGLEVDPLLKAFLPDLWNDYGFSSWFWGSGTVHLIRSDDGSCPRILSKDVTWIARSWKLASFIPP